MYSTRIINRREKNNRLIFGSPQTLRNSSSCSPSLRSGLLTSVIRFAGCFTGSPKFEQSLDFRYTHTLGKIRSRSLARFRLRRKDFALMCDGSASLALSGSSARSRCALFTSVVGSYNTGYTACFTHPNSALGEASYSPSTLYLNLKG